MTELVGVEHEPKMWDNLKANFMDYIDEIELDTKAVEGGRAKRSRVDLE